MTGYVFWCSNCKDRHSGECPPTTNPCADESRLVPAVGSRWFEEQNFEGNTWTPRSIKTIWTVVRSNGPVHITLTVVRSNGPVHITLFNGSLECDVPLSAFSDKGTNTYGIWFRLRPCP